MNSRLALGTVQFGLDYGIANQAGRVPLLEVTKILQHAAAQGVDTLDTAIAYGDSESCLGQAGVAGWRVVTKLPALPDGCEDVAAWVQKQIKDSLQRLGVSQLHGVLLHRPEQLFSKQHGPQLLRAILDIQAQNLTRKIGVSIYAPEELERLVGKMPLDLVQMPLNILDRRMEASGWVRRLKDQGAEVHVRSAFLQGLLLMPAVQRPQKFARWSPVWSEWSRWLGETGLTPLQACLGYVLGVDGVDKIVVGTDSVSQLNEIFSASDAVLPSLPDWGRPVDTDLINPARWSQL
jgi:aryl-alcohol dehydrogenase-like predicted oxidoreductase